MNDAEYYRTRAERAREQAARTEGRVRDVHLELAQRYAERVLRAAQAPAR